MTLLNAVILIAVLVGVGWGSYIIIMKFFKEPIQTVALFIVGFILLAILIVQFFPGAANYRIWH